MPTTFEQRAAAGVPLLLARPEGSEGPLPLVLWFHGFGVDKETHRPELERIAEAGFLAAGVDAAGHGARRLPDLDARIDAPREEALRTAVELASRTAAEVPAVVRALAEAGLADPERAGAAGISMGGYAVYGAVLAEPGLRAAVAILGSPEWPLGDSPHLRPEAFHRTALLSITAERDENVPPDAAREFHRRLAAGHPEPRLARYLELPGAVHLMGAADWATTMDETLRWLALHLRWSAPRGNEARRETRGTRVAAAGTSPPPGGPMSEDRRPNVAGVPLPDEPAPAPETGGEELRREARLLRDRKAVDGHEPPDSPPEDDGGTH